MASQVPKWMKGLDPNRPKLPPLTLRKLSRRTIHELVWSKPLSEVADELGLELNVLRRTCRDCEVPYPDDAFWRRKQKRHDVQIELLRRRTKRLRVLGRLNSAGEFLMFDVEGEEDESHLPEWTAAEMDAVALRRKQTGRPSREDTAQELKRRAFVRRLAAQAAECEDLDRLLTRLRATPPVCPCDEFQGLTAWIETRIKVLNGGLGGDSIVAALSTTDLFVSEPD